MVLYYEVGASSGLMDDGALGGWIAVTEDRILLEALLILGDDGGGLEVLVDSVEQSRTTGSRRRRRRRGLRQAEEGKGEREEAPDSSSTVVVEARANDNADLEPPPALGISFVAIVEFESDRDDWDPNAMVAGGFDTSEDREDYLAALSREDPAFEGVERMSMEVNGEPIPEAPTSSPSSDEVDPGGGDDKKALYYIVGGVVGGALLFLAVGVMFYRAGKQSRDRAESMRDREEERASPPLEKSSGGPAVAPPPQRWRHPPPEAVRRSSSRKYGEMMIDSQGDDDISTLGDPYLGEGAVKFDSPGPSDEAIAEQSVVSASEEIYVYGTRQRLNTKDGGSTMYTEGDNGTKGSSRSAH